MCLLICIDFLIYLCILSQPFMIFSCGFVHGPGFKAITHGAKPQPAPLEPRPRLWRLFISSDSSNRRGEKHLPSGYVKIAIENGHL